MQVWDIVQASRQSKRHQKGLWDCLGGLQGLPVLRAAVKTVAATFGVQQRHSWGSLRGLHLVHWAFSQLCNQQHETEH